MFGSHLSIAGSMNNALKEAESLGLDCVQVFTKNQQQWKAPPLSDATIAEWKSEVARLGWHQGPARIVSHASYLANLASPVDQLYRGSIDLMRIEIDRCEALGIPLLCFHPGAFTTSTLDAGLARIADAVTQLLEGTRGYTTVLCLENVAGQGSTIGRAFEELATLRTRIAAATGQPDRIAFCIDTCHAHAAGYDLSTRKQAAAVIDELDAQLGLQNIRTMHFNDSKGPANSRLDRHQHIGEGTITLAGFAAFVNHPAFNHIPKIMETPKGDQRGTPWDAINLARLRSLIGSAADTFPTPAPIEGDRSESRAGPKPPRKAAAKPKAAKPEKAAKKKPAARKPAKRR